MIGRRRGRSSDKYIIEKDLLVKTTDEECRREFGGIFEEGMCRIKVVIDRRKPNEVRIIRLIPEDKELAGR